MTEPLRTLEKPEDYVWLLENGRPQNKNAIFRQAILTLDTKDLADFLIQAGKVGVINVGHSEDPFFSVLRKCHNRGKDGIVTDKKLTELCNILSTVTSNASLVTMIVDTMLNRRERVEVDSIIAERSDETRREAFNLLLKPQEQSRTKEFEQNLKALYKERERLAGTLKFDLHRSSDARTPGKIFILNAFLAMTPDELGALDEIANANGGSIFNIAMSVEKVEDIEKISAFIRSAAAGKTDSAWKDGKAFIQSLCL